MTLFERTFAALATAYHPHARPKASPSFLAVLDALFYLGYGHPYLIAQKAALTRQGVMSTLAYMQRLGLAEVLDREGGYPGPRRGRVFYQLTEKGRELARLRHEEAA